MPSDARLHQIPVLSPKSSANPSDAHKNYWAGNGGSPDPDSFFPGFEAGWNAACEALANGGDLPDADAQGKGDDVWEWKHGFKQGAEAAQQAGQVEDAPEEEQAQEGGDEE